MRIQEKIEIPAFGRINGFAHVSGEGICHTSRGINIYLYNNIVFGTHSTDSTRIGGPLQLPASDSNAARNILALLQALRVAVDDGNRGTII